MLAQYEPGSTRGAETYVALRVTTATDTVLYPQGYGGTQPREARCPLESEEPVIAADVEVGGGLDVEIDVRPRLGTDGHPVIQRLYRLTIEPSGR